MGRTFAINPVAVSPLKGTSHELAYIVLGHPTRHPGGVGWDAPGAERVQAEAVAHLVGREPRTLANLHPSGGQDGATIAIATRCREELL
jgi:hypothetical protein